MEVDGEYRYRYMHSLRKRNQVEIEIKPDDAAVQERVQKRAELESKVFAIQAITTQAQADAISEHLTGAIDWRKWWEEHNAEPKKKAYEAWQAVTKAFKKLDEPAENTVRHCRFLLGNWMVECQRREREEQQRLIAEQQRIAAEQAERDIERAEAEGATAVEVEAIIQQSEFAPLPPPPPVQPKSAFVGAGLAARDNWTCEYALGANNLPLSEAEAVKLLAAAIASGKAPAALLTPNMTALNSMARSLKETMDVPGFRAVNRPGVARKR